MGNLSEDLKEKWPFKFTLSEIQCAAGILGLKKVNKYNQIRIKRAKLFIDRLSNIQELELQNTLKKDMFIIYL